MSMIIVIGLLSKEVLADFRRRLGGFTPAAAYELFSNMMGDTPCSGVVKRFPKGPGVDIDSRYAARARRGLELLAARQTPSASVPFADACSGAALFISPLVPRGFEGQDADLNDGGGEGGAGPVLSPQRCKDLLDCFRSVDLRSLEAAINEHVDLFEGFGAYTFHSGAQLVAYLQSYASILGEAVIEEKFYTCFFT